MSVELSSEQQRVLHASLDRMRTDLTQQLASLVDSVRPVDLDEPIGRLSRMDAMQQQKMAEASKRAARQTLDRVVAALAACERGEYGLCLRCEEPIGYKRLSARPETALCHSCQSAKEKQRP